MIDLVGKDMYISDLVDGEVYLVGNNSFRTIYLCKREGFKFYFIPFTTSLVTEITKVVVNNSYVKGIDKRTGRLFEEVLDFRCISVQELLYLRIPSYIGVGNEKGYISEYLAHNVIQIR